MASSSVALKLATRWWGMSRTKPTVSLSMTVRPPPRSHPRVRVVSVAKSRSSAYAPPEVSELKSVDLPALV